MRSGYEFPGPPVGVPGASTLFRRTRRLDLSMVTARGGACWLEVVGWHLPLQTSGCTAPRWVRTTEGVRHGQMTSPGGEADAWVQGYGRNFSFPCPRCQPPLPALATDQMGGWPVPGRPLSPLTRSAVRVGIGPCLTIRVRTGAGLAIRHSRNSPWSNPEGRRRSL